MAWVYIIGTNELDNHYKIGITTGKLENRLKKLQTGNSAELYFRKTFQTNTPFKLELMLHNHYHDKNIMNEWFYLDEEAVADFVNQCKRLQENIDSLKENPFFKSV